MTIQEKIGRAAWIEYQKRWRVRFDKSSAEMRKAWLVISIPEKRDWIRIAEAVIKENRKA